MKVLRITIYESLTRNQFHTLTNFNMCLWLRNLSLINNIKFGIMGPLKKKLSLQAYSMKANLCFLC